MMPELRPINFAQRLAMGQQQAQQREMTDRQDERQSQMMELRKLAEQRAQEQHGLGMQAQQQQMDLQNLSMEQQQAKMQQMAIQAMGAATKNLMQVPQGMRSQWLSQARQVNPFLGRVLDQIPEEQLTEEALTNENIARFQLMLSSGVQPERTPVQFGATNIVKDSDGNLFYATQARNPSTNEVETKYSPLSQESPAAPVGRVSVAKEGLTPDEKIDYAAALQEAKDMAKQKVQKQVQQEVQGAKLSDADEIYNMLSDSDLDLIYGKGEKWYPEFFRSQKGIDLIASRDRLASMLALGARGELKGQGSITDSETAMLEKAVSVLNNPNISPDLARKAIDNAMQVLYRSAGQEFKPPAQDGDERPTRVKWGDL